MNVNDRMKTRTIVLSLMLLLAVAEAVPAPTLDVAELTEKSDLIVVGLVESLHNEGPVSMQQNGQDILASRIMARMRVDKTLKGDYRDSSLAFRFLLPDLPIGYSGIGLGTYRMIFLSKFGDSFVFADPYHPSLIAVPGGAAATATTAVDSVVLELDSVVRNTQISNQQKLEAIHALASVRTTLSSRTLEQVLSGPDELLKIAAAAALLQRDDILGMSFAESAVTKPPAGVPPYLISNLVLAIQNGVKNESAIPSLVRLLNDRDTAVRRAATLALRNTGSRLAVPGLSVALSDPDFQIRYYAVVGLAEITGNNEWRPLEEEFREKESLYMQYWRNWVAGRPSSIKGDVK